MIVTFPMHHLIQASMLQRMAENTDDFISVLKSVSKALFKRLPPINDLSYCLISPIVLPLRLTSILLWRRCLEWGYSMTIPVSIQDWLTTAVSWRFFTSTTKMQGSCAPFALTFLKPTRRDSLRKKSDLEEETVSETRLYVFFLLAFCVRLLWLGVKPILLEDFGRG